MRRGRGPALAIGLAIPWFLFVVISPFLNFPTPRILGMPPLMFFDSIGIVITTILLSIAYKLERRGGIIE